MGKFAAFKGADEVRAETEAQPTREDIGARVDVVLASDCLAPPAQESPHEAATRKLPPYVMPEARQSGTRARTDKDDE